MGQNPTYLTSTNSTAPAVLSLVLFLLIVCQLTINTMPPKKKSKAKSRVNLSAPAASISPDAVTPAANLVRRKKRSGFTRVLDQVGSPSKQAFNRLGKEFGFGTMTPYKILFDSLQRLL